ncbi:MAG: response regulator transcription factor [Candidatus Woesearchaeota archaeon]
MENKIEEIEEKLERIKSYAGKSKKPRILIVEDEPSVARLIKEYLKEDFVVDISYMASEAEERIKKFEPDFITMDIMMPKKDGITFARELKEKGVTNNTPIIFVSAKTDWDSKEASLFTDGWAYLEKPFTRGELLDIIYKVVRIKEREDGSEKEI